MKAYRFVGLDRDVWLPDDIVVEIAIVPSWRTNIRSNSYFTGQTSYTQHETANFNRGANATMHKNWLHGGAGGSYVGFNFVVDDKRIIQLTPLNEVTWAAGTPEGNKFSYHTELCVNADIDHVKARRNAAALAGGIFAAKGWNQDRLFQHNIWWGKDCPYLLRREGRWQPFVNQSMKFKADALAAAGGKPAPAPSPQPAPSTTFDGTKDVMINGVLFNADKRTVTLYDVTNEREWSNTRSRILRVHPAGKRVVVLGWVLGESVNGENRWWVTNVNGGRVWSGASNETPR